MTFERDGVHSESPGGRPRAIIFGGSGFIGFHLVRELVARGFDPVICDLVPPREYPGATRYVECDVRRPITVEATEASVAFNLAAVHRTPGYDDFEYYETNVRGALFVSEWCSQNEIPTLVFTSSISVYGPTEEERREESECAPTSAYGRSKLIAEEIHQAWSQREARRLIVTRPAVIFGQHEHGNFTRLAHALQRGRFLYPGRSDTIKSCGYVKDLVEAFFFALEDRDVNLFNFAYPQRYSIHDVCDAFSEVSGFRAPHSLPPSLVKLGLAALPEGDWARSRGFHVERIQKLLVSTNVYPGALVEAGFKWPTDIISALSDWREGSASGSDYD